MLRKGRTPSVTPGQGFSIHVSVTHDTFPSDVEPLQFTTHRGPLHWFMPMVPLDTGSGVGVGPVGRPPPVSVMLSQGELRSEPQYLLPSPSLPPLPASTPTSLTIPTVKHTYRIAVRGPVCMRAEAVLTVGCQTDSACL